MTRGELQRDNDGKPLRWIGTNIDVTDQKQSEEELRIKLHVLNQIQDRVIVTDLNGVIKYVNQAEIAELGYSREEVLGSSIQIYGDSRGQGTTLTDVLQATLEDGSWRGEIVNKTKDGECIVLDLKTQIIKDEAGNRIALAGISRDISEQKKVLQEIEYLSYHDVLTGLYNRRFYEEELHRLDVPRNLPLTLMMVDVNGLKLTNDAFGHTVGDQLLKGVADALRNTFRQDDIIARIGGDEFAVLLPNTDEEQAHRLKKRAVWESGETVEGLPLSVACGWAVKTDSNDDIHEVFKEAEDHMYRDKVAERNSYRYKTIQMLMQTLFAKSRRERSHTERVSHLCEQIGTAMGLGQAEIAQIMTVGELHDIGKISIDSEILNKNGTPTDSEWEEIKRHPQVGYSILSAVNDYGPLADYVLAHHERWDGTGYPNGLKGEEIPLMARIVAVADAYDAMVSDRPYRQAMSNEEALAEIKRRLGSQFDHRQLRV